MRYSFYSFDSLLSVASSWLPWADTSASSSSAPGMGCDWARMMSTKLSRLKSRAAWKTVRSRYSSSDRLPISKSAAIRSCRSAKSSGSSP